MPSDTPSGLTRYDAGAIAMGLGEGDDGESTDYVRYSDVASLEEENKRMREALKPFARYAETLDANKHSDDLHIGYYYRTSPTVGDCRKARASLSGDKPNGE
jgi:hypothetical protein